MAEKKRGTRFPTRKKIACAYTFSVKKSTATNTLNMTSWEWNVGHLRNANILRNLEKGKFFMKLMEILTHVFLFFVGGITFSLQCILNDWKAFFHTKWTSWLFLHCSRQFNQSLKKNIAEFLKFSINQQLRLFLSPVSLLYQRFSINLFTPRYFSSSQLVYAQSCCVDKSQVNLKN